MPCRKCCGTGGSPLVVASLAGALGKVVNLNRARKKRRRLDEQRRADANAVAHGRTAAERLEADRERARLNATLDGAHQQPCDPEEPSTEP